MERIVDRAELDFTENCPSISSADDSVTHLIPFEFIEQTVPPHLQQNVEEAKEEEEEDEMDFCLFAPTAGQKSRLTPGTQHVISRIRLQSPPSNANTTPGLEIPDRDRRYYFTGPLTPEELQRFQSTAVSGEEVKARARGHCCYYDYDYDYDYCPGSAYTWKVQHIRATRREAMVLRKASEIYNHLLRQEEGVSKKRKRPGKKTRVKTRIKLEMAKAAEERGQREAGLKEAAEREKRTRRNREKKLKKKAREKAKKVSAAGGDGCTGKEGEDEDGEGDVSDASSSPD